MPAVCQAKYGLRVKRNLFLFSSVVDENRSRLLMTLISGCDSLSFALTLWNDNHYHQQAAPGLPLRA